MSEKVIGRIDGDRFVPAGRVDFVGEEGETTEHLSDGYMSSDAIETEVERRMQTSDRAAARAKAREQIEAMSHILAALDVSVLELEELDLLYGTVAERAMSIWVDTLTKRVKAQR